MTSETTPIADGEVEALARIICAAKGADPDACRDFIVPTIIAGRLSDTGHDARVVERRQRKGLPLWRSETALARAILLARLSSAAEENARLIADAVAIEREACQSLIASYIQAPGNTERSEDYLLGFAAGANYTADRNASAIRAHEAHTKLLGEEKS